MAIGTFLAGAAKAVGTATKKAAEATARTAKKAASKAAKGVTSGAKKAGRAVADGASSASGMINKVRRFLSFGRSLIGKIVFFLLGIILIVLLIYVIAGTIMKSLAKLMGIDAWVQSGSSDYDFIRDLKSSGYDSMLTAEELIEYHSFEYAVLMDAARYMEENGTEVFDTGERTGDILCENLSLEQWAQLNALSFNSDRTGANNVIAGISQATHNTTSNLGGTRGSGDGPTQFAKNDLVYYSVYNEYTNEYSLVPYLELTNKYDILTYYFELTNGNTPDVSVTMQGTSAAANPDNFGNLIRFVNANGSESGNSTSDAAAYIAGHVRPVTIKPELNGHNFGAYKLKDAAYGSGPSEIELYANYGEGLYFETDPKPFNYRIPLRVLLDRFLPNAALMEAWNILSDDDKSKENVVDEIQKIYSEACLDGEEYSGEKLLVKDVYSVAANLNRNKDARDLYDSTLTKNAILGKYLDGAETTLKYGSYKTLFDSRGDASSGDFTEDVLDDVKLAITNYSKDYSVSIEKRIYERIIEDVKNHVEFDETLTETPKQYIIYTPSKTEGEYFVTCKGVLGNDEALSRLHYDVPASASVSSLNDIVKNYKHQNYSNPYNAPEDIVDCFVPFAKIAYRIEDGFRKTVVIFHNNGSYAAYMVKTREMEDYGTVTNNNTFAIFESNIVKSTTFREWSFAQAGKNEAKVSWLVTDNFEGMGVEFNKEANISVKYKYVLNGEEKEITVSKSLPNWGQGGESLQGRVMNAVMGKIAPDSSEEARNGALFSSNQTAVIRTPEDPLSRNYEGLLDPIKAASPNAEAAGALSALGYTNFYSSYLGEGEASFTDMAYVNLKALGLSEGEAIDVDGVKSTIDGTIRSLVNSYASSNCKSIIKAAIKAQEGIEVGINEIESVTIPYINTSNVSPSISFSAVFPTRMVAAPVSQEVHDRSMPFYLVKDAVTWSGKKHFKNTIVCAGRFNNRNNMGYLISNNSNAKGILDLKVEKEVEWRCKMFAPIFAGELEENSRARENDVLLILSKWQELSDEGLHAADHFIRDLYSLIQYSKGIESGDSYLVEPQYKEDGSRYIHEGSYEFLYLPDEILMFDDTTSEKAFWFDRLLVTPEDVIDETKENYLRSKTPTFTWQIVDYSLYEECVSGDGTASAYALWPYGGQYSRSLYSFAANASAKEAEKVGTILPDGTVPTTPGWGGYSKAHGAADLYGRASATKIYNTIFSKGDALIKAEYSNGKVRLTGVENTGGAGLYFTNVKTKMKLGDETYTFNGTAAAVYGYELYRQTLILKNPDKAEQLIKKQLIEEMTWTKICAVAPGIIEYVKGDSGSGFTTAIRHTNGFVTTYCHMKRFPLVQEGQYVGAGTVLGYEGTTGKSKGIHLHTSYGGDNPTYYLYPFFTPFYYEEKASENDYSLASEYMSTIRTVFPYGQYPENEKVAYNTEIAEDGTIKIKNYVPYKPITADVSELLDENSGYEKYIDYSKLPTENVKTDLGKSEYNGDIIRTNPDYFDLAFIAGVQANDNRIKGAEPTTPWMITEPKGGLLRNGGWEYSWSYKPLREKPIIAESIQISNEMYVKFNEELERQIQAVGRGTRGAAVVAARYLAGFPYAIPYMGGRSFDANIGYYGHRGISTQWGRMTSAGRNGIDCTGFINWCLINAYVESEGSSLSANTNGYNSRLSGPDRRTYTFREAYEQGIEIKPGDFYHVKNENYDPNGSGGRVLDENGNIIRTGRFTHIGMIIGLDDDHIYVAESLGSVKIGEYDRKSSDYYVTLNDNLYAGEGNYDKSQIFPPLFKTGT